jgi:hypothetical protein
MVLNDIVLNKRCSMNGARQTVLDDPCCTNDVRQAAPVPGGDGTHTAWRGAAPEPR